MEQDLGKICGFLTETNLRNVIILVQFYYTFQRIETKISYSNPSREPAVLNKIHFYSKLKKRNMFF